MEQDGAFERCPHEMQCEAVVELDQAGQMVVRALASAERAGRLLQDPLGPDAAKLTDELRDVYDSTSRTGAKGLPSDQNFPCIAIGDCPRFP